VRWSPVNSFLFRKSPSRPVAHPLTFTLHFYKLDFKKGNVETNVFLKTTTAVEMKSSPLSHKIFMNKMRKFV